MKKRYMILAGVLALSLAAAGCGKDKEEPKKTPAATATPTLKSSKDSELVDMKQSTEETIVNTMGTKSSTASEIVFTNMIDGEVSEIYIRPYDQYGDDEEWGEDLIKGSFTLEKGEKAAYYLEKNEKDEDGNPISLYDIRISFSEEDRNECFFRKIPLQTIEKISLCMDGQGEEGIPYATYKTVTGTSEVSTLKEVKERLGLTDTEDEEMSETEETEQENEITPSPIPEPTQTPEEPSPTSTPEEPEDPVAQAEGFIGRPLGELIAACGDPTGQDYEDEPETGKTGYHYYPTFTVSTTVDENGNEIVAGVW